MENNFMTTENKHLFNNLESKVATTVLMLIGCQSVYILGCLYLHTTLD